MGREAKGSIDHKGNAWYFRITLRNKKRHIGKIPPRPSGQAIDRKYAQDYAKKRAEQYAKGEWDPEAAVAVGVITKAETVAEYGEAWLATLDNANLTADTRLFRRCIVPVLGSMRMEDVKRVHVKAFIDVTAKKPSKRGGNLAPRTVRNIYSVLQRLFAHAEEVERIPSTPCRLKKRTLPKIIDKNPMARRQWVRTKAELKTLITSDKVPVDRRVLYALEFLTGARFSEIAVLRWSDWDRKAKPLSRLCVSRSRDHRTGGEKGTKTGVPRDVPVHPSLEPILNAWWSNGWERHYGRQPADNDFIVPSRNLSARDVRNNWTRLQEDCDAVKIDRGRQHDARRTFISLATADGARKEIMEWITHDASRKAIINQYMTLPWETICKAVSCLKIGPLRFD